MNRPILSQGIEKLTPRGLLIILVVIVVAALAVFLYRDISVDNGGITVNKGESIETITTDHVIIGEPDPGSGVRNTGNGKGVVQSERGRSASSGEDSSP